MDTKEIYTLRNSFSIIGLTGKTGSGCTEFSKQISKEVIRSSKKLLRTPNSIKCIDDLPDKNIIFKRKYTICYKYCKSISTKYKTISYISVLLFYILHYCIRKKGNKTKKKLINSLKLIINDNFKKSKSLSDLEYVNSIIDEAEIRLLSDNFEDLILKFEKLPMKYSDIKTAEQFDDLHDCFYNSIYENFVDNFFKLLGGTDFYQGSFFVHRVGNKIRATGNPFEKRNLKDILSSKYIYSIAYVINKLIKAWKIKDINNCHICIDSLRNSLEIMFFKERYSAFYMIALNNENQQDIILAERINTITRLSRKQNPNSIDNIVKKTIMLDEMERKTSDFKKGYFYAPDVENCIQISEIHINNPGNNSKLYSRNTIRDQTFYSTVEQWMRIKALISHPGIVTPTHEERCMQIAYNSKFNSGCISRQVGAVITDENNTIRSVGWNDVPKGSIPCNLRTLEEIIMPKKVLTSKDKSYSEYELNQKNETYNNGGNFSLNSKELFTKHVRKTSRIGLNYSFCFKSLHNKYELNDNQVHTRSLHAEENAMLQVSKFGGQPLQNGTLYTTASPCELCAKKAYQLGMKKIIYIDPYPGISMQHILKNGYNQPLLKMFSGIIGRSYNKLFEPIMSYKDELSLITSDIKVDDKIFEKNIINFLEKNLKIKIKEEFNLEKIKSLLSDL